VRLDGEAGVAKVALSAGYRAVVTAYLDKTKSLRDVVRLALDAATEAPKDVVQLAKEIVHYEAEAAKPGVTTQWLQSFAYERQQSEKALGSLLKKHGKLVQQSPVEPSSAENPN
jgi:ferritin